VWVASAGCAVSLLKACIDNNVKNFVFSSTAALYGMPSGGFELNWRPKYDNLQAIVASSLAWEHKLVKEPWS
jgi:UDP-glucose 4-epimerase